MKLNNATPPLTQSEMRAALSVPDDHPLWLAVLQCVAVQRENALAEVTDVDTQRHPHLLHYYAGTAQGMATLAAFLEQERAEALKAQLGAEEEGESPREFPEG